MNFADLVAKIAERVRDTETEAAHGDGDDLISDDAWLANCAEFILPASEKESKELSYQIGQALFWIEPDRALPSLDTSMYAVEHLTKIGRIIVDNAIKNGLTAKQLGGDQ